MSLAVIDSSALVTVLVYDDPRAAAVEARLRKGDAFFAPTLLDYEVLSALRGIARSDSRLTDDVIANALADLQDLPVRRMRADSLLPRIWQLRHNCSAYDAAHVALAESLEASLITCDARLGAASQVRCPVEVIGAPVDQ
ncbi:type II toxin-antitoxin system VapC family toxin [Kitasatospora sp. RB6PN24]|uniref:type II toxin-antitoxin system VapC family toxin n=1 Tax=Kitasatospora humi TaxID=2893891 RepID=UPI001E4D28CF|nr:type II toxin-antitoxin system VapC family toxin [Kitasatospora humi]MCC9310915.1 type II toxin-antitoxin system VapC family toxin [Kitasatospora humi]